jgi:hypothetical protein
MGDLTVGAIIFLTVVWAIILATAGVTLYKLTRKNK